MSEREEAMHVLIVEDNPGDARLLRAWLAESTMPRFRVSHVSRLADAGARAEAIAYDAVLLDLSLPDSNGLETVTRFREHAPDAAIVVVTGVEDAHMATETVHHGAQEYLVKDDINSRSLTAAISRAVVRRRLATSALEAAEQARASASRLRSILHELPDGVVIHDRLGVVSYANPAAELMLGCRVGNSLPASFVREQIHWSGAVEVVAPDGSRFAIDVQSRAAGHEDPPAVMLFLRPIEDHVVVAPELGPIPRATLWAGLDCMAWRVDRLRTLLRGWLGDRAEPRGAEA
ncbi:MAG: response regulator, partial [Deltaproteobacteria bacterium]|nr:response regulator [Nannocystaceae bacterium]